MCEVKWLFNALNYGYYCLYSFTIIDVFKKILINDFNLGNATNFVQFLASCIVLVFGYFKLITYIRDSKTRSKILEQELIEKEKENTNN
jgi:hypothetical protein